MEFWRNQMRGENRRVKVSYPSGLSEKHRIRINQTKRSRFEIQIRDKSVWAKTSLFPRKDTCVFREIKFRKTLQCRTFLSRHLQRPTIANNFKLGKLGSHKVSTLPQHGQYEM